MHIILAMIVIILQSYEQAFEQIKEATGITDIDQLVTKFIEGTYHHDNTISAR